MLIWLSLDALLILLLDIGYADLTADLPVVVKLFSTVVVLHLEDLLKLSSL